MKKVERRGQTWTVYTKEEFLEREDEDLAVAKHGESLSDADYVESVDGYVVPVIKTYYLSREPERLYYVTPYGSYFPFTGRGVLSTDPDEFVSGLKNPKNEKPLTDKQKHFAILYARTRKRAESYKKAYGVNWRMEILRNEADKLLKKKKVQDYVDELTAKAMAGIGVEYN